MKLKELFGCSSSRSKRNRTRGMDSYLPTPTIQVQPSEVAAMSHHIHPTVNYTLDQYERYGDQEQSSESACGSRSGSSGSRCSLRKGDRVVWLRDSDTGSVEAGTVRWVGWIQDEDIAGIEFDNRLGLGSGWYRNERLFRCAIDHGGLVAVAGLLLEEDYLQQFTEQRERGKVVVGGSQLVQPALTQDDCVRINGLRNGIQGQLNSCYLDATLFSMFSFSSVFDSMLTAPTSSELGNQVQEILREGVVNPLRRDCFTPAGNLMKLRAAMGVVDSRILSEEMDPQEFLQVLFKVLQVKEFLSFSHQDYFHQLLVPSQLEATRIPSVQFLLEESFKCQKLRFKGRPNPALVLQMPRSGNRYKVYEGILPNLNVDITDLMEMDKVQTPCTICGASSTYNCPDCSEVFSPTTFCTDCTARVHAKRDRIGHFPVQIRLDSLSQSRTMMNLFAIICIETSHFVSFVKAGVGREAPWVFFDSMADRVQADGAGQSIPKVTHLPFMGIWLDALEKEPVGSLSLDGMAAELKRLLSDSYICLYS